MKNTSVCYCGPKQRSDAEYLLYRRKHLFMFILYFVQHPRLWLKQIICCIC